MLNIGIIGCGKIADQHADQINKIDGCKIIAVCDKELLMAKQMAERYGIENYYSNLNEMFEKSKPDVVHITTPPQEHFNLGKFCLDAGCHVYIEKPFTVNHEEAVNLIEIAKKTKLKVTVGHNVQYSNIAIEMRSLINNGYLGGPPLHMESVYCYNLSNPAYAKALLGDNKHWVRLLPGQLLQNNISHGIAKIAEYLEDDNPEIFAQSYTSKILESINENDIKDELRVMIYAKNQVSAYFTFSTQMGPLLHQFRIYGPDNSIILDDDNLTLIKLKKLNDKSFLKFFRSPLYLAKEYKKNSRKNIKRFIKNQLHMNEGMKNLIGEFYRSINDDTEPPFSYKEILLTSKIMDEIFKQIKNKNSFSPHALNSDESCSSQHASLGGTF